MDSIIVCGGKPQSRLIEDNDVLVAQIDWAEDGRPFVTDSDGIACHTVAYEKSGKILIVLVDHPEEGAGDLLYYAGDRYAPAIIIRAPGATALCAGNQYHVTRDYYWSQK